MNRTAQCMSKAAQLRAQANKLEKIALLLDDSDEITGADLGIGAGALGLLGGGAYGVNKLMQNRAATEAAAAAAEAAAVKAAQKSRLLKGVLGLGGLGAGIGVGLHLDKKALKARQEVLGHVAYLKNLADATGAMGAMGY